MAQCLGKIRFSYFDGDVGRRCERRTKDPSGYCKPHRPGYVHYTKALSPMTAPELRKLSIVLRSDWGKAKERVPDLALKILRHYAYIWLRFEPDAEKDRIIGLVWTDKLSSLCPSDDRSAWYQDWEKMKVWYVADQLDNRKHKEGV